MARPCLRGLLGVIAEPILVPERGEVALSPAQWSKLRDDPTFWSLVDGGILSVSRPSRGATALRGSCYVGRAITAAGPLELVEKVDGALASLLGFATEQAFRLDPLSAPTTDLGQLAVLLVRQFHQGVFRYVSRGRERRFVRRPYAGSLIGGRIDVNRTLNLRARGLGHLIAFDKNELTRRTPKNRLLLAALREVESLAHVIPLTDDDLAFGRSLSQFFHDCRDVEVLFGRRAMLAERARQLADSRRERDTDLLALAAVLLSHESFEHADDTGRVTPRAWFLNLETLFEHAVRTCFRDVCSMAQVVKGTSAGAAIFPLSPALVPADPDIVIYQEPDVAVGDVKYKDWDRSAGGRPDLYQLLVHSAAFDATTSFLVYPHDRFQAVDLGHAVTGPRTWLFSVDVRAIRSGVQRCAQTLGLSVAEPVPGLAA